MSAVDPELDSDLAAVDDDTPRAAITDDVAESKDEQDGDTHQVSVAGTAIQRRPSRRFALLVGLVIVAAVGGLTGWLGSRFAEHRHTAEQRAEFVRVARQGATNLTSIDWQRADADVQRILDTTTGTFYDDFVKRSKPFVDVVKQVQSKSQGSVTSAGLQSVTGDQARVLVAIDVETTTKDAPKPGRRAWRMRVDVKQVGNTLKVSNVEFVL